MEPAYRLKGPSTKRICDDSCSPRVFRRRRFLRHHRHRARREPGDVPRRGLRLLPQMARAGEELVRAEGGDRQFARHGGGEEQAGRADGAAQLRSEEHTSELQSLMRISYAVFCWNKKITTKT